MGATVVIGLVKYICYMIVFDKYFLPHFRSSVILNADSAFYHEIIMNKLGMQSVIFITFILNTFAADAMGMEKSAKELFSNLEQSLKNHEIDHDTTVFISGSAGALMMSNAFLKSGGHRRIYCQPSNVALSVYDYIEVSVKEYRDNRIEIDYLYNDLSPSLALSSAIMDGLVKKFPCK